jgi:hypothetical protein
VAGCERLRRERHIHLTNLQTAQDWFRYISWNALPRAGIPATAKRVRLVVQQRTAQQRERHTWTST